MSELVTRAELARRAQAEGLDVTERTIRYWAGRNLLPRPVRLRGQGTRAFYPIDLLDLVRALVALRPAKIRSLREQVCEMRAKPTELLEVGEQQFKVLSTPISWSGKGFEYCLYALADNSGDLVLLKKKVKNVKNVKQVKNVKKVK